MSAAFELGYHFLPATNILLMENYASDTYNDQHCRVSDFSTCALLANSIPPDMCICLCA